MIIDVILDRKDGFGFSKQTHKDLLIYAFSFGYSKIIPAVIKNDNNAIKKSLCDYIDSDQTYNPNIKDFINSVDWSLPKEEELTQQELEEIVEEHFEDDRQIQKAAEKGYR